MNYLNRYRVIKRSFSTFNSSKVALRSPINSLSTSIINHSNNNNICSNSRRYSTKNDEDQSLNSEENQEYEEEEYEEDEEIGDDEDILQDLNKNNSRENIVLSKNIEEISTKISDFYSPKVETISLSAVENKKVTSFGKCINLNNRASQLLVENKLSEAESVLLSGISLYERECMELEVEDGKRTKQTYGYLLSNMGYVNHLNQRYTEAIKYYTKSLVNLEKQSDKQFYANSLLLLAEVFSLTDNLPKAIETCKLSISTFEKLNVNALDERYSFGLLNLSSYLSAQKNYKEALPYCEKAFGLLEKSLGRYNELVQSAATNLSKLYNLLNMTTESEKLDKLFRNPSKSSLKFKFNPELDLSHIDMAALRKQWSEQGHQKLFDVDGFYKSSTTAKKEFKSFFKQLKKQGVKIGPEIEPLIKAELESLTYSPDIMPKWEPRTYSLRSQDVDK